MLADISKSGDEPTGLKDLKQQAELWRHFAEAIARRTVTQQLAVPIQTNVHQKAIPERGAAVSLASGLPNFQRIKKKMEQGFCKGYGTKRVLVVCIRKPYQNDINWKQIQDTKSPLIA